MPNFVHASMASHALRHCACTAVSTNYYKPHKNMKITPKEFRKIIWVFCGISCWVYRTFQFRSTMKGIALLATLLIIMSEVKAQSLAFTNVSVVDVTEGTVLPEMTVIVTGNRITNVGKADLLEVSEETTIIDGKGKYLIPGLWDMHTHTSSIPITRNIFLPLFVANGVTGIRNMASDCFGSEQPDCTWEAFADPLPSIYEFKAWREEIEGGTLIGPKIVAGSAMLDGPGDEASTPFKPGTPEHAREHARILKERGVDFAKIYNFIPRDAYFAFAEEANRIGLPFAGHVPEGVKASEASELGQRSIEHAAWGNVAEECSAREDELRRRLHTELGSDEPQIMAVWQELIESHDVTKCAKVYETFIRNGTWVTPTLVSGEPLPEEMKLHWSEDPRLRYLPREEIKYWHNDKDESDSMVDEPDAPKLARFEREITLAQHRAGVPLLAGSDNGTVGIFPGFGLHDELEVLVATGLTEAEALRTATLEPAKYLNALEIQGTVEVGKLADLVLLNANPLDDITNTQKIEAVVANGRFFDRKSLDEILENVAREAQKN